MLEYSLVTGGMSVEARPSDKTGMGKNSGKTQATFASQYI